MPFMHPINLSAVQTDFTTSKIALSHCCCLLASSHTHSQSVEFSSGSVRRKVAVVPADHPDCRCTLGDRRPPFLCTTAPPVRGRICFKGAAFAGLGFFFSL